MIINPVYCYLEFKLRLFFLCLVEEGDRSRLRITTVTSAHQESIFCIMYCFIACSLLHYYEVSNCTLFRPQRVYTSVVGDFKGALHPWTLFLKTSCFFFKNKATLDNVFNRSDQKCSKELKNKSSILVEPKVMKLQSKMCGNQYFPCFDS